MPKITRDLQTSDLYSQMSKIVNISNFMSELKIYDVSDLNSEAPEITWVNWTLLLCVTTLLFLKKLLS